MEDHIRCGKDTGLRNLPFFDFAANAAWVECVLVAQDLLAWTQVLALDGALAHAEPLSPVNDGQCGSTGHGL
ncbi:MAG: hypothetical protein ACRDYY_15810 [Acidimicrobiales bacterium]